MGPRPIPLGGALELLLPLLLLLLGSHPEAHAQSFLLEHFGAEEGIGEWNGPALYLETHDSAEGSNSYGLGHRAGNPDYKYWSALSPIMWIPPENRTGGHGIFLRCETKLAELGNLHAWLVIYRFDAAQDPIDMGVFYEIPANTDWTMLVVEELLLPKEVESVRIEFNMGDPQLQQLPSAQQAILFDDVDVYLLKLFDVDAEETDVGRWKSAYGS